MPTEADALWGCTTEAGGGGRGGEGGAWEDERGVVARSPDVIYEYE